jgi:hypothetical protein
MSEIITVDGTQVWSNDYDEAVKQLGKSEAIKFIRAEGTEDGNGAFDINNITGDRWASWEADIAKTAATAETKSDMEDLFRLSAEYGKQQVLQAEQSATRMIEQNIERFPEINELAQNSSTEAAGKLNEFMRGEFETALDSLYPEWRTDLIGAGATAQADSIALTDRFREKVLPKAMQAADDLSFQMLGQVSSMLSGELPDDVAAQLKRQAAEVSQQIGVRGQAAQYLTARDLGRTSLDLIQAGMQAAPGALNLAPSAYNTFNQTLQNPVATGQQVTNLLAPFRAPQVDAAGLYGGTLNLLAGAGTINATSAFSTAGQIGSNAGNNIQNQLQFGAQQQSQAYWNSQNFSAQQRAAQVAAGQSGGGIGQAIGTVVGGIGGFMVGGPMGAMAGASVGGAAGASF